MALQLPRWSRFCSTLRAPPDWSAALEAQQRRTAALHWIALMTGKAISVTKYKLYLGLFKNQVKREVC
ncbi:hypothetical protein IB258_19225 [Achromobacter sp. ACM02]|uniref:hypothetical protein n=1 Tax=Achromobacter sp. ACM02 TaxID=2769305 RepID=UPI001780F55B|nr:hypothetical protein [Achromobacter sp. ACM02]MBD9383392.1 hypothetical protein [Achromobacter sp. ACM02]